MHLALRSLANEDVRKPARDLLRLHRRGYLTRVLGHDMLCRRAPAAIEDGLSCCKLEALILAVAHDLEVLLERLDRVRTG
jgi:hypothetical protein